MSDQRLRRWSNIIQMFHVCWVGFHNHTSTLYILVSYDLLVFCYLYLQVTLHRTQDNFKGGPLRLQALPLKHWPLLKPLLLLRHGYCFSRWNCCRWSWYCCWYYCCCPFYCCCDWQTSVSHDGRLRITPSHDAASDVAAAAVFFVDIWSPDRLHRWEDSSQLLLCLPSEEVGTCWFTFVRSVCVCAFSPSVWRQFITGGQTRDVDSMLG